MSHREQQPTSTSGSQVKCDVRKENSSLSVSRWRDVQRMYVCMCVSTSNSAEVGWLVWVCFEMYLPLSCTIFTQGSPEYTHRLDAEDREEL